MVITVCDDIRIKETAEIKDLQNYLPLCSFKLVLTLYELYLGSPQIFQTTKSPFALLLGRYPELAILQDPLAKIVFHGIVDCLGLAEPKDVLLGLRRKDDLYGSGLEIKWITELIAKIHGRTLVVDPVIEMIDILDNNHAAYYVDDCVRDILQRVYPDCLFLSHATPMGDSRYDTIIYLARKKQISRDAKSKDDAALVGLPDMSSFRYKSQDARILMVIPETDYANYRNEWTLEWQNWSLHLSKLYCLPSLYTINGKKKKESPKPRRVILSLAPGDVDEHMAVSVMVCSVKDDFLDDNSRVHCWRLEPSPPVAIPLGTLNAANDISVRQLYKKTLNRNQHPRKNNKALSYVFSKEIVLKYTTTSDRLRVYVRLDNVGKTVKRREIMCGSDSENRLNIENYAYDDEICGLLTAEAQIIVLQKKGIVTFKTLWYAYRLELQQQKKSLYRDDICRDIFRPEHPGISSLYPGSADKFDYADALAGDYECSWREIPLYVYRQLLLILTFASNKVPRNTLTTKDLREMEAEISSRMSTEQAEVISMLARRTIDDAAMTKAVRDILGLEDEERV